ncbi:O-antigen ligase family protein [Fibrella sp. WM1]|uniref:O-antigen ligase family protein n=1 Tax=Fibrella musci TaxID=3242485 RepID=UPI003522B875
MNFEAIFKRLHLYLFLFSELALSSPLAAPLQSSVRRIVVIGGISYAILFFPRLPRHLRIGTVLYLILIAMLMSTSYFKYGQAIGSLQYMSLSLSTTVVYGGFMGAWFLRDISIKEIVTVTLILFAFNQLALGRILTHQFNSTDRSTSSEETYYLTLVFCFYMVSFLQDNRGKNMNMAIFSLLLIIGFFHRTLWVTTGVAIVIIMLVMRGAVQKRFMRMTVLALPYLIIGIISVALLVAARPQIMDNLLSSIDDIENSNTQGTAGWRYNQRELYLERIVQRPFFGWMYDGYDDGELTAVLEGNADWIGVKGTFIHSGYIHVLYHYGLFGMVLMYGMLINTLLFMWRRFRQEPGYIALFVFLCTGFVFSWSYQLPLFYWVLVGVGSYMACLVPVEQIDGQLRRVAMHELEDDNRPVFVN